VRWRLLKRDAIDPAAVQLDHGRPGEQPRQVDRRDMTFQRDAAPPVAYGLARWAASPDRPFGHCQISSLLLRRALPASAYGAGTTP
jgi:hypothetical protein